MSAMLKKIKYGKIAIVIFLTALIWVWADLTLDERFTVINTTVTVARGADPNLWVSFDGRTEAVIKQIELKGPTAKISDIRRKINDGTLQLDLFLTPEKEGISSAGRYTLNVADFVRRNTKIKALAIAVEECKPTTLDVRADKLIKKDVTVECFDDNGKVKAESIKPATVNMYVPADRVVTAKVQLTRRDVEEARVSAIEKKPYIELAQGIRRESATAVMIKMPPVGEELKAYTITTANLGYCLSENLQGKYKVQVLNLSDMATVLIKATTAAKQAYEAQPFQVLLYILDDDRRAEGELKREVVYNFPQSFVAREEIVLNQDEPALARFQLISITAPAP